MTELVQDLAWQEDALRLRATTEMGTSEIGEAVGKHPATIRKLFARNAEEIERVGALNGHGDRVLSTEEASEAFSEPQTTVYDHLPSEEPAPEDDPDPDYDKDAFTAEAGEAVGPMPPATTVTFEYEMESAMPVLKGTRQMALELGPNAAPITESTVTFKSEKWPSGHFGMGDVVSGTFTARITSTPAKEKYDKDMEEFVAAPMAYGALITEIEYEVGDVDH